MGRARRGGSVPTTMLTQCERCSHELWSEVRAHGAARLLVHFDDDERSATYAEHAPRCPGCGAGLDRGTTEADGEAHPSERRGGR